MLDLHITHERWGSRSDPTLNGNLHYLHDVERSLNETSDDKIRKYHTDCNDNPPTTIDFKKVFLVRLGGYIVNLCVFHFYNLIEKLASFFSTSGVQVP